MNGISNTQKSKAMKNFLVFAMILVTGLTAYPQATRSAKETKSERSGTKKEATQRTATRSENKSANRSASVEKSRSTNSGAAGTRQSVESRSTQRPRTETKTTERPRTETKTYQRPQESRTTTQSSRNRNEGVRTNNEGVRTNNQGSRTNNQGVRTNTDGAQRSQQTVRPQANTDKRGESGNTIRTQDRSGNDVRTGNNSSATRVFREGKGTLTRGDGTVIRHQNDEIFTSRKYKLDYDNYESLRRSDEFNRHHHDYDNWYGRRSIRIYNHYDYNYIAMPWEWRRSHYYYRAPHHVNLIWTPLLFHRFMFYYPTQRDWNIEFGSQIETISAYEAKDYAGTVRQVYGKVDEVFYSPEDENYILYIGGAFPYHDLSVVIPRDIARNISMSPKWFFDKEFVWVIGLINVWEGKPEIIVRDEDQIRKY